MRLKLSTEQFMLYALFNKKFDHSRSHELKSKEREAKGDKIDYASFYLPNEPVPRIDMKEFKYIAPRNEDGSIKNTHALAENQLYATFEECERLRNNLCHGYKMETLEVPVNKRIYLGNNAIDGHTDYNGEAMILLDMSLSVPQIMYVNCYIKILNKLRMPCWFDIEIMTKGKYIIMPLKDFHNQFNIQLRPEYLYLMETSNYAPIAITETIPG